LRGNDNSSLAVKERIMSVIADMASRKEEFVKTPGKDFTRKRKLSFEDTISAFIQQRDKLLTETFKYLLYEFTSPIKI